MRSSEVIQMSVFQAKSQFKRRSTANNVEIHIPVPTDADSPKFKTTVGSVKWVPENSEIVWSIKSFPVSARVLVYTYAQLYTFLSGGEVNILFSILNGFFSLLFSLSHTCREVRNI